MIGATRRSWWKTMRKNISAYLFVSPFVFFFIVFMIVPFIWLFVVSLYSGGLFSPMQKFVGLRNYRVVLSESFFWAALRNTFVYVGIITVGNIVFAMGFALLSLVVRRNTFFRTALIFPFFCPIIMGGFMWRWMIHFDYGPINIVLRLIGLQAPNWLSLTLALPTVAAMEVWRAVGYYTLVYIAGLMAIPGVLYDAARVDGVNVWQKFRYITLPLLKPCFTFIVIMNLVWSFQIFDSVWIITGGGPAHKSASLTYYVFTKAFQFYQLERASVGGFILMVITFAVATALIGVLRSEFEF